MASVNNDTSGLKLHNNKLEKYCRVNTELLKTFNIDTTTDQKHVHPKAYCHKCHTIANKISSGAVVETAVVPVDWESHGTDCWVCKGKAGRPKKATKKRGRPKVDNGKRIANTVLPPQVGEQCSLSLSLDFSHRLRHSTLTMQPFLLYVSNKITSA